MTRADLKRQLVIEKTTKTLLVYNGGALSCHARQIDSYYFIIATRQAREKNFKLAVAQVPLRDCLHGVWVGPQIGEVSCGGSTQGQGVH